MRIFRLALACILFPILAAQAQEPSYSSEFGFKSDNDSYLAYGQDRYYTNGLFIYFRHATDQSRLKKSLHKLIWEVEAGQHMYNAQSGNIPDIDFVDRPFAGYLYGGASLNMLFNSENSLKAGLQIGTIGPDALGKEAQELLHDLVGFYEISGWQWQVNNEIGVNASLAYNYLIHRSTSKKVDFTVNSYLNVGNTFSGAGAGILFRAGAINQLFSSASTQSRVSNKSTSRAESEKEFFFYARPMLHLVAYDASIQGGMFRKDKGPVVFDPRPLVFSQQLGGNFSKNRWTIDFSVTFKSKEIKSVAKPHQFGSMSAFYRFN